MQTNLRIEIQVANAQALTALKQVKTQLAGIQTAAATATKAAASSLATSGDGAALRQQRAQAISEAAAAEKQITANARAERAQRITDARNAASQEAAVAAQSRAERLAGEREFNAKVAAAARQRRAQNLAEERAAAEAESRARDGLAQEQLEDFRRAIALSEQESAQRMADSAQTRAALERDMIRLRATAESVSNQIARNPLLGPEQSAQARGFGTVATRALTGVSTAARTAAGAVGTIGRGFGAAGNAVVSGATQMAGAVGRAATGMRNLSAGMIEVGRQSQWLGRQIEFRLGLPLLAAAAASVNFAKRTDEAWVGVAKVYNGAAFELDFLRQSVRLTSDALGIHQEEVMGVMQIWAQAGRVGIDLAKITDLTMRTAILGNLDYAESAKGMLVVQEAFQLSTDELADTLAKLNLVENETTANAGDLIEVFRKAGAAANQAGVTIEELAGMTAALVPAVATAGEAGTGLATIMRQWGRLTPQASDALRKIGIDASESAWRTATFTEQLEMVAAATKDLDSAALRETTAILGQRHSNKLVTLLNDLNSEMSTTRFVVDLLTKDYGELTASERAAAAASEELQTALQSDSGVFNRLVNNLRNMSIEIGIALLPIVNSLIAVLRDALQWFRNLDPAIQKIAGIVAVLVVAIGPLMGVLGSLSILLGSIGVALFSVGKAFLFVATGPIRLFTSALGAIGAFFAPIAGKIALLKTALAGLPGVFQLIPIAASAALIGLKAILVAGLVGAVGVAFIAVANTIRNAWDGIREAIVAQISRLPASVQPALLGLVRVVENAAGLVFDVLAIIPRVINDAFKLGIDTTAITLASFPGIIARAFTAVVETVKSAALAIYSWFSWINPFARHSPSLVENVLNGTAIISEAFAEMTDNAKVMGTIEPTLHGFLDFVNDFNDAKNELELGNTRALIQEVDPAVLASFDQATAAIADMTAEQEALQAQMDSIGTTIENLQDIRSDIEVSIDVRESAISQLTDQARELEQSIDDARRAIDALSSTSITGEQAADDEIFQLTQERKNLELELKRLERAFMGSTLPDITRAQMEEIQEQMDRLDLDIEIAELGRDVTFEPLRREIESLANPIEEMSFDDIIAGIVEQQQKISDSEQNYEKVLDLIGENELALADLVAEHDAINAEIEIQENLLAGVESEYDAITSRIEEMTRAQAEYVSELERAVQTVASATGAGGAGGAGADAFTPFDFEAAGAGGGFLPEGAGPDTESAWEQYIDEQVAAAQNALDTSDLGQRVQDWWSNVWSGINPDIDWDAVIAASEAGFSEGTIAQMLGLSENERILLSEYFETGEIPELTGLAAQWDRLKVWWDTNGPAIEGKIQGVADKLESWRLKTQSAVDFIAGKLREFVDSDTMGRIAEALRTIEEKSGGVKNILITLGVVLVALALYFGGPVAAIGALVAALIWLEAETGIVTRAFEFMAPVIGGVTRVIGGLVTFITGVFAGDWDQAWQGIKDVVAGLWTSIEGSLNLVQDVISGLGQWLWDNRGEIWDNLKKGADLAWQGLKGLITNKVIPGIKEELGKIAPWLLSSDLFANLLSAFTGAAARLIDIVIPEKVTNIGSALMGIGTWILDNAPSFIVDPLVNAVSGAFSAVAGLLPDWILNEIGLPTKSELETRMREAGVAGATEMYGALSRQPSDAELNQMSFGATRAGETAASAMRNGAQEELNRLPDPVLTIDVVADTSAWNDTMAALVDFTPGSEWAPYNPNTNTGGGGRTVLETGGKIPAFASGGIPTPFGNARPTTVGRGFITDGIRAIVGEGSRTYAEYVIPTDPKYRDNAIALTSALMRDISMSSNPGAFAIGGRLGGRSADFMSMSSMQMRRERPLVQSPGSHDRTVNIYGDLSFPNITRGDQMEELIENLEAMA